MKKITAFRATPHEPTLSAEDVGRQCRTACRGYRHCSPTRQRFSFHPHSIDT